ncbi:hypothetical protein [Streptomyces lavendulocolor]|uniref:hypothetical protein n=1 Tax=Streptomyces lavendulocolor TaxID=67316 RepID=UPI003C2C640B
MGLFAAVPGALASQREYASAPACPDGTRSGSCTMAVPATVRGPDDEAHGRSVWHWVLVTEQGSDAVRRVRMAGAKPVFDAVRAGDVVTLTYWRDAIRTVRFGTASQETYASPSEDWRLPTAFGLLTLPFGVGLLLFGRWLRFRFPATLRPALSRPVMGILAGACLSCVGFTAAMLSDGLGQALLFTVAGIPPVALLVALYARRMRRRTTEPMLTAPCP